MKKEKNNEKSNEKIKNKLDTLSLVNYISLVIGSISLIVLVIYKNMYLKESYNKYFYPGLIAIILIIIALNIFKKKVLKIFSIIINILLTILISFGIYNFSDIYNRASNINSKNYNETIMQVVALKENININSIEDIKEKEILAIKSIDEENITKLEEDINTKINSKVKITESSSYKEITNSLVKKEKELAIVNSVHEGLDETTFKELRDKTKVIYEFKIVEEIKEVTKENKKLDKRDAFVIYISGIDTYGPITTVSRSDVNILITVNRKTGKILITNTPRDSYVKIAGGGKEQLDKLTHAGMYGVDSSLKTLENLYDIDIDYYVKVNFTSFIELIDLLGNVTVKNDVEFRTIHGTQVFKKGEITLNSKDALAFARERKHLEFGDEDRGKNQAKVIEGILNKLKTKEALSNYRQIIDKVSNSVQTNMQIEEILYLVNSQIENPKDYEIIHSSLDGESAGLLPSFGVPGQKLYMHRIYDESLKENQELLKNILYGVTKEE